MKKKYIVLIFILLLSAFFNLSIRMAHATADIFIKERVPYKKSVRVRMPPQIMIDTIQKELQSRSPKWRTFWNNFVVEEDIDNDEFLIIARSEPKKWAFTSLNTKCIMPYEFPQYKSEFESQGGSQVRMDVLIGIKRKRSWFRYEVNVYEPMYDYWKNDCFSWILPPGTGQDPFYSQNYNMKKYAETLRNDVYQMIEDMRKWAPPKLVKQIPIMKGSGIELIGGGSDDLTDEQRKLSIAEQNAILKKKEPKKSWFKSKK